MATAKVDLNFDHHDCLLDSPGLRTDDKHMVSVVTFTLFQDGESKGEFYAEIQQRVGGDYETKPSKVGVPHHVHTIQVAGSDGSFIAGGGVRTGGAPYRGAFNQFEFERQLVPLFQQAVRQLRERGEIEEEGPAPSTRFWMEGSIRFDADAGPGDA